MSKNPSEAGLNLAWPTSKCCLCSSDLKYHKSNQMLLDKLEISSQLPTLEQRCSADGENTFFDKVRVTRSNSD